MEARTPAELNAAAGHDDSGIGMRSPEDDFSMGKFGFGDAQMNSANADRLATV
jgi:regulatory factor X